MAVASQLMTAEGLLRMPRDGWRYELVEGELRRMPPPGFRHGKTAGEISGRLFQHVRAHNLGVVPAAETGYLLQSHPDTVRAPDVSFVSRERLAALSMDDEGYFPGAPDFLVEVVSPSDSFAEVQEKVYLWLAAGAKLVVVILPRGRSCFVYRPGQAVLRLGATDTLDASDVVPGWTLHLAEIFEHREQLDAG
jgi:Uma2 family endonuclease